MIAFFFKWKMFWYIFCCEVEIKLFFCAVLLDRSLVPCILISLLISLLPPWQAEEMQRALAQTLRRFCTAEGTVPSVSNIVNQQYLDFFLNIYIYIQ